MKNRYLLTFLICIVALLTWAQKGTGSLIVNISPLPIAEFSAPLNAGNIATIQFNNLSQLSTSYTWIFGDGSPNSTLDAPVHVFPKVDTTYLVTLIATNTCGTDTIQKIVNLNCSPLYLNASITSNGPLTFCEGNTTVLSTPANPNYQYTWLLNGMSINGATQSTYSASQSGIYQVLVEDVSGCKVQTTGVTVRVLPNPGAAVYPSAPVLCEGGSTSISVEGGHATYLWSNGATVNTISVSEGGEYNATITGANGCIVVTPSVNVISHPKPNLTLEGKLSACAGDTVTLNVYSSVPNTSFKWSTGSSVSSEKFASTTDFTITGTSAFGCSSELSSNQLVFHPLPDARITHNKATPVICEGKSLTLQASTVANGQYVWNSGKSGPTLEVQEKGTYQYTVTDVNTGCTNVSATLNTTVVPNPEVFISGQPSFCEGTSITLLANYNDNAQGASSFLWNNGNIQQNNVTSQPGNYVVTFTTLLGCEAVSPPFKVTMLEIPIAKITPTKALPICSGESLELDAAVAGKNYNYLWSTGATTSKINVNTPGSYQVTVLNDICQAISPSMMVTVNPTPIPNLVNLGLDAFCESQSTKLSAGILPAGTTIVWQDGSTQTELFANKPGDYFFILTNDFGCSAKSATKSLTVFPNPKPIIDTPSNTNFCEGSAVMLATNLNGNYQYLWSNGNSTPSTLITTPGDYSVVVTDQNNCTGTAATVMLKMLPRPVPELNYVGLQRILAGQSITLQTTKTYNTYQWSNGANTPTLTTNLSEDFHLVSVKDSNGCTNVAPTESVRILVKPTLTLLSSVLQGVAAPNALVGQYRWYKDGQQIANANATSYQPIVAGKYQIEAYYPNGSKDISDDLEYIPTGFEEIAGFKDFELFPNPASENVWVRWTQLRNTEDLELHITDSSGKLISVLKNPNSAGQNIDLNNKVAGTYIATLKCVGKVVASKTFIVKDY